MKYHERLEQNEQNEREHLHNLPCPIFDTTPFVSGQNLSKARVALVSTAGLHRRSDPPFSVGENGYRLIPKEVKTNDLVMSHISANFDRTGFQQDLNVVFPLDRLNELVHDGFIDSIAEYHYSFMGATDPAQMEETVRSLTAILKKDRVNTILLVPV